MAQLFYDRPLMEVILSNRLEILADALRDALFSDKNPFETQHVIVPSHHIKNFLAYRWAKDKTVQIVAGIKILTIAEALRLFFPQVPTPLQLSLQIEEILEKNQDIWSLADYLKKGGPGRLGALSDQMSSLFLNYGICEKEVISDWKEKTGWQQSLWKQLWNESIPWEEGKKENYPIHLFHLSFLPLFYFRFFQTMESTIYHLSPSQMFWGDFFSEKKQAFLLKKVGSLQKESWKEHFREQNSLLANNGKVYQLFFRFIEENNIAFEDNYETPLEESMLTLVQKEMLDLEKYVKTADASIQIHSAPSKQREVEIVWEIIQGLGTPPDEVTIYAPDIMEYVPYIHMVFGRKENPHPYTIFDLELENESPLAGSLKLFLELPALNFEVEAVLKLLSFSNFLEKWQLESEDVETLKKWTRNARIYFDIQTKEPGSWERGLGLLIDALVSCDKFTIELSQADLLGKWIEIIRLIRLAFSALSEKKRVSEWMIYLQKMAEQFFSIREADEVLLKELCHLGKIEAGPFPFTSIGRALEQVFTRREGAFHAGCLNSIKFSSLKPGISFPSKSIILMGMEDGVFPRIQRGTSLEEIKSKEVITAAEEDRALFLEELLSARCHFILTYTRINKQDGKETPPSLLVQELMRYLPDLHIQSHPHESFDESYFQEAGFKSHSHFYFSAAKKFYETKSSRRPIFSLPETIIYQNSASRTFDIRDLKKLARHPLQFYLEKKHGIYFQQEKPLHQEFILSYLDLASFRKASLREDVCFILHQAEKRGELPLGALKDVAIYKIKEEITDYHKSLTSLGLDKADIFSVELRASCKKKVELSPGRWVIPPLVISLEKTEITIIGRLDDLSLQGILVHGEDKLDDLLKAWPLYLIARALPFDIQPYFLLTKEGKRISPPFLDGENALIQYMKYVLMASEVLSPCFPKFAKTLLQGDTEGLEKAIQTEGQGNFADPILQWLRDQEAFPSISHWHHLWAPLLKEVFRPLA
jgi:exodeoxyribonuclease V gamma subunit